MVALLITSFFLLAGITYVIHLWQRPTSKMDAGFSLPPPRPIVSLFDDAGLTEAGPREVPNREAATAERRLDLLGRASANDKGALLEAHASGDDALYDEVLNALALQADSEKRLLALLSFIARSPEHLRVNGFLAEKFIESWKASPDRNKTAEMLHVAALAGDARLYQAAIETAYQFWRDRKLQQISATELRQLIESEFWILAPAMRNSGAGFVLKRKLAHLRRKLAAEKQ